ncbi:uncharacterized protein LTR77_002922 [Saxophila tyrrhenica]|uniref:Prenylcysteine lyase domain-containing protein n=1 Tax=Saxophila tyrrhenica TaxID=1690608 RepID=A0AAV9PJ33_9PEZI|nr:hypothetical protein LTR77_002922 [Saxophila tyrrhenica]
MRLIHCIPVVLASCCGVRAVDEQNGFGEQIIFDDDVAFNERAGNVKQVAIVGAGAGGASTAYHLSQYATAANIPINISIFERNSYVGGRTTTVNAWDDPTKPVELGGSIFVKVNKILNYAVETFNLSTRQESSAGVPGAALAVWDGQEFVFVQEGNYGWWDTAKLLWKYGTAPIRTMRLMRTVVGKFLEMYDAPVFPFESLTEVAHDLGLLAVTAATGEQYLAENDITGAFVKDIISASTRVNYATNVRYIHGLEAMVCMAAEDAHAVHGGNWQMFDRMIEASNAKLYLDNAVTGIHPPAESGSLTVDTQSTDSDDPIHGGTFDEVVIATPLQFANLRGDFDIDEIPYVQLHVTLLTSPHLLSPAFFNLSSEKPVPKIILTVLPSDEEPKDGPDGVGSPGFFSISLLDPAVNPETNGQEYIYKIFSSEPPNSKFLSGMLGFQQPEGDSDDDISEKDISWMFRKLWDSYPYEFPRVTFEKIKLGDGLWYTSGMDSFISTMETNALMGKNVARLIVDEWVGKRQASLQL